MLPTKTWKGILRGNGLDREALPVLWVGFFALLMMLRDDMYVATLVLFSSEFIVWMECNHFCELFEISLLVTVKISQEWVGTRKYSDKIHKLFPDSKTANYLLVILEHN